MTYLEKIRSMSVDEIAEFIAKSCGFDGFMGKACQSCPYYNDGDCMSKDVDSDCKIAVKALLNSEVKE